MENNLRKKITALFELRQIPRMLVWSGHSRAGEFIERLYRLQEKIYYLDKYLESNWELENARLLDLWVPIIGELQQFQLSAQEMESMIADLRTYQKMEEEMRQGNFHHQMPIDYSYYIKSCDVRLMRQLIFREFSELASMHSLEDWVLFDFLTEIQDDLEDLAEDLQIFNGNRLLLSLIHSGTRATRREYNAFLDEIERSLREKHKQPDPESDIQKILSEDTRAQLTATRKLLDQTLKFSANLRLNEASIKRALSS